MRTQQVILSALATAFACCGGCRAVRVCESPGFVEGRYLTTPQCTEATPTRLEVKVVRLNPFGHSMSVSEEQAALRKKIIQVFHRTNSFVVVDDAEADQIPLLKVIVTPAQATQTGFRSWTSLNGGWEFPVFNRKYGFNSVSVIYKENKEGHPRARLYRPHTLTIQENSVRLPVPESVDSDYAKQQEVELAMLEFIEEYRLRNVECETQTGQVGDDSNVPVAAPEQIPAPAS